jgi:hypothetical protein
VAYDCIKHHQNARVMVGRHIKMSLTISLQHKVDNFVFAVCFYRETLHDSLKINKIIKKLEL